MLKYLKIVAAAADATKEEVTTDAQVLEATQETDQKEEVTTDVQVLEVIQEADQTEEAAVANLDQIVREISNRIAVVQTVQQDALVAILNQQILVFQNQNVLDDKHCFC